MKSAFTMTKRRMTQAAVAAVACCGLVGGLTACQASDTERPASDTTSAAGATTSATSPAAGDDTASTPAAGGDSQDNSQAEAVTVVDSSPGGAKKSDPLWAGLDKAAGNKSDAYLHVLMHVGAKPKDSGTVTLTPDTANSVSVSVDAKAVHKLSGDNFYQVQGTFGVKKTAESAYTLSVKSTDERKDLTPSGDGTKTRCTAGDAGERIQKAADDLSDGKQSRKSLKSEWAAAPEVWWGIQLTAASLKASDGNSAGDYLTEACASYLPDDAG